MKPVDGRTHGATIGADDGLATFLSVRPRLFGIAYRMLGSAAEAEDVVQDVWVRWQTTDRRLVRNPAALLVTTATRLSINVLQSARSRRETCVGRWPREPADTSTNPWLEAERGEALASGVLLLLEQLTPAERAAYILRESFDYAYIDIANVLRLQEANARQVVTRARQHVAHGRRTPTSAAEQRRLLEAFIRAAQNGDTAELEGVFARTVGHSDSEHHGKGIGHDTRHHRRHWSHRIEARGSTEGGRPCGGAGIASHGGQHAHG